MLPTLEVWFWHDTYIYIYWIPLFLLGQPSTISRYPGVSSHIQPCLSIHVHVQNISNNIQHAYLWKCHNHVPDPCLSLSSSMLKCGGVIWILKWIETQDPIATRWGPLSYIPLVIWHSFWKLFISWFTELKDCDFPVRYVNVNVGGIG